MKRSRYFLGLLACTAGLVGSVMADELDSRSISSYSSAYGAGFDCSKAMSSVEKMTCANPSLSARDRTLSRIYGLALEDAYPINRSKITNDQKNWISHIRNTCTDIHCLSQAYDARIKEVALIKISGGSATYLSNDEKIASITKQIQQDLQAVGITQPLSDCSHILSLNSHPESYGAFCSLSSKRIIAVCEENFIGNLAVNFYGFTVNGPSLATFTQAACPGG